MESNLNKIKNLMQEDNHQPLPPELDWSNMKDGIFDKMQSIEQTESSSDNPRRSWKRIGLFLCLFFTLSFGLYSLLHKSKTDQHSQAHDMVQVPKADGLGSESNVSGNSASSNQPGCYEEDLSEMSRQKEVDHLLLTDDHIESNQDFRKPERAPVNTNQSLARQQLQGNDSGSNFLEIATNPLGLVQEAAGSLAKNRFPNVMLYIPELQEFPPYDFGPMDIETRNHSILDTLKTVRVARPATQPATLPDQLMLEGGITFWDEGYGNSNPDRAQYEAPIPSFQLQGYYLKGLKRNYFVMAGLQYQQLESKLSYDNTIENYKITFVDTILQVQNNLLTGEETIIRGDVEEFVKAERSVRHYNKTQLFKASLAVGNRWRFNSFQTDVYLGAALNSWVRNEGRMFSENTIIDYNGASNSFFQNQWKVDGILGVRLHYFLTPEIGVTTGFQTQRSLMNWGNQEGINFYPASLSLQLGVSYALR